MFLQHQPFREGTPGVWTVPVEERQGNNLLAMKGLSEERADYQSPQSAQRGQVVLQIPMVQSERAVLLL